MNQSEYEIRDKWLKSALLLKDYMCNTVVNDFSYAQQKVVKYFSFQNDSLDPEIFTFDKFYQIYRIICPRTDIDQLFEKL